MQYYSIKDKNHKATFAEAMTNGLAPNQGLYFPEEIPLFPKTFFKELDEYTLPELASKVLYPYVKGDISKSHLDDITQEVFDFPIPLVEIEEGIFSLELFHGPTLAFKDVGARFLSRSVGLLNHGKKIRVLVATSGDTGSAVANGFLGVENTEVIVLYPKGKVSELQQKQFASLGQNIVPIAIEGTFDDCQALVKHAFSDPELNAKMNLTSANSINIARWIPQSVYYYWAVAQLPKNDKEIAICVPSGNLGNITSGLLAKKTGLPVDKFIAASNSNNIVPSFLLTGVYEPRPTQLTLANAMDVGDPNNFPRLLELYEDNIGQIQNEIVGYSYDDDEIKEWILNCYTDNNYLLDPHGATGYGSIKEYCEGENINGIFLETAHPGKFNTTVEEVIKREVILPQKLQEFAKREIHAQTMVNSYDIFKQFLLDNK